VLGSRRLPRFFRAAEISPGDAPGRGRRQNAETAKTHASLFAEHRELYGENVAVKLVRCLQVTDAEYEAGLRTRERYRERLAELMHGTERGMMIIVAHRPEDYLGVVAQLRRPPGGNARRGDVREIDIVALSDDDLPASVQIVGRPGGDALVLGVGRCSSGRFILPTLRPTNGEAKEHERHR
jgi:hypothetical protein